MWVLIVQICLGNQPCFYEIVAKDFETKNQCSIYMEESFRVGGYTGYAACVPKDDRRAK